MAYTSHVGKHLTQHFRVEYIKIKFTLPLIYSNRFMKEEYQGQQLYYDSGPAFSFISSDIFMKLPG
jgi:hypothetical protein